MPVKELNFSLYNTLCSYKKIFHEEYEIIVVFDKYKDNIYNKFQAEFNDINIIHLYSNPKHGRINALNYGYANTKGAIIKCIDADDILLNKYFTYINILRNYEAHCHNADLIDNNNEKIGTYCIDNDYLQKDYKYALNNLKSHPRWMWSFNRRIGDIIFPIPAELFAEDVWFSLLVKKHCKHIYHMNESVYLYRQHIGGEWGGIKNFSSEVMAKRAKWNLDLIPILLNNKYKLGIENHNVFSNIIHYYELFINKKGIYNIIIANTTVLLKIKIIITIYFPNIATVLIQYKWNINKLLFNIKGYLGSIK